VIKLDPTIAMAYNNRGFAYDEQGELDKAIADYTQATRNNRPLSAELSPPNSAARGTRAAGNDLEERDRERGPVPPIIK
jgi:hypothetical protein